jgi:acyl-CoA synthetase (NDP forming)/RimJ/RimL family protein N-acetyltransferase
VTASGPETVGAPSFPPHWEFDVVLADGGTVHIRPILPSDAETYLRFFHRLSRETRYYRFFSPKSELSDAEVAHFTTVDFTSRMALVAIVGGEIIAVARYDRLDPAGDGEGTPAGPPDAEVAFTIDDAHQGRGLGTLMLEYLAAAGRENGIGRFVAETMPDNRRMVRVFHDAGYQTIDRFADGLISVAFPIATTDAARDAVERREHRAEARSIERILAPSSVAVIGASSEPGSIGHRLFLNLLAGGFAGPVYPVNPNATHVASVPAYATVADVPGEVDLAVIATPAETVPAVVEQCATKGVKGLVVISTGFAEAGPEGIERAERVLEAARRGGLRVLGPNSMGVANTANGLNATFVGEQPLPGRIGLQSESGAVGMALLEWATRRGLGISSFASIGDKVDVSGNDLLQYWEDDPATDIVLLYLESFGNPRKFARIARRVSMAKPIVAVKSGRGSTAAAGAPTGRAPDADVAVDALFRQAGVIRVDSLTELFDVASLLDQPALPERNRVAIIGNARGAGLLAADAAVDAGLEIARPDPATAEVLTEVLGPYAVGVDAVTLPLTVGADQYAAVIDALAADRGVDAVHVVITPTIGTGHGEVAEAIRTVASRTDVPLLVTHLSASEPPRAFTEARAGRPVPTFTSPEAASLALARVSAYAAWRRRDPGEVPELEGLDRGAASHLVDELLRGVAPDADVVLDDADAGRVLAAYGIAVDHGAGSGDGADPGLHPDDGVVTSIGLVQDPAFGPLVAFGVGGVAAELLADRAFRILPLTDHDAADLVRSVRASPLLFGHGGRPTVAVDQLEEVLLRIAALADDIPEVVELRADPVVVGPTGVTVHRPRVVLRHHVPGPPDLVRRLRT